MDLLVGDDISISQPAEGLSDEDYQQKKAEYKKKSARLMVRYRALSESGREMDTEAQRGFSEMYGKLYQSSSDFEETEMTGFVWLLLQKPNSDSRAETAKEVSLK